MKILWEVEFLLLSTVAGLQTPFDPLPSSANCTQYTIEQPMDHFSYSMHTEGFFHERYFVCSQFQVTGGPVFFYTGNEADVTLFVNNTGLMWEFGQAMGAMLVFAEHRYYGESLPSAGGSKTCLAQLTVPQVLSDFANLIVHLYAQFSLPKSTAVVTFGSSYGGMLSGWMRMKYPHLVEGAVASSAPVFYSFGVSPESDGSLFARTLATAAGPSCSARLRKSLEAVDRWERNALDKKNLVRALSLCRDPSAASILQWASEPWGYLAMANYPYPNAYIVTTAGVGSNPLPTNPLNSACAVLTRSAEESDLALFQSLRESLQPWYNNTRTEECFAIDVSDPVADVEEGKCYGDYSFQRCADLAGPYQQGTPKDPLWPKMDLHASDASATCMRKYGRSARLGAAAVEFGNTVPDTVAGMSNIIWSNGEFDPWGQYGVDCSRTDCPASVFSPVIPGGAHSSDLMFSHPLDSAAVTGVRRLETAHISSWIEARTLRYAGVTPQRAKPEQSMNVNVVLAN